MASNKLFWMACGFWVTTFTLCLIGLGTGYWFVSADDTNPFESIGLWDGCFDDYEHTSDLVGKTNYGCWWMIFYKKNLSMAPWFVIVQMQMITAVISQTFIPLMIVTLSKTRQEMLKFLCVINVLVAYPITSSVLIFGVAAMSDRTWIPRGDQMKLGWSYGLTVLSAFFSWLSFVCLCSYTTKKRYELRVGT